MRYCKRCLQPDTRPNTRFDTDGQCPACAYHASLATVHWPSRRTQLAQAIREAIDSGNKSREYDCIIGVSGGKDSTRQAIWARDRLQLSPLLVAVGYPPRQSTDVGAANIANLINLGFDVVSVLPPPETWRRMMRYSFIRYANWARSTELALFAGVPQLALEMGINVILWGENPALQLGDLATLGRSGMDGNSLRNMNTLGGASTDWLREAGFDEVALIPYRYPSLQEFDEGRLQIFFMGWALGDWSLETNAAYSGLAGLRFREDGALNTGDVLGVTSLDEDWVTLNQMIKYFKYGFGRATDYANEAIRRGTCTREAAIESVTSLDGQCADDYIQSFCEYLEISVGDFWRIARAATNRRLFDVPTSGRPVPKFTVGVGII